MDKHSEAAPQGTSTGDPDPQQLLPGELREDWILILRRAGYWLFTSGVLLGTGLGLSVAGIAFGPSELIWGLGASILLVMAGAKIVLGGYEEKKLRELGRHLVAGPPRDGQHS